MRGRMITAHDHFDRCIELCRENGFGRIAVANLHMRGLTRYYQNDLQAALDDARTAAETAAKVGHHRAEIVARYIIARVTLDMVNVAEGKENSELGLALARRLGAHRFEAALLLWLAKFHALEGHLLEANKTLEEALSISRETGVGFVGPGILGALAVVTDDPAARRRALDEGEEWLRKGCVGHNYFYFYRDAIDASHGSQDWDGADRFAAALEVYTGAEPLPWSDLIIARGRALAAYGRGKRDDAIATELRRLRDQADRVGLKVLVPAIDAALGAK